MELPIPIIGGLAVNLTYVSLSMHRSPHGIPSGVDDSAQSDSDACQRLVCWEEGQDVACVAGREAEA